MRPQVAFQPEPTGPLAVPGASAAAEASIELYWLPLGAGGWFVRLNGRIWEAVHARREHRRPLDLYHSALVVRVPEGRFVVEDCWPIPDGDGPSRGVAVEGPVGSRRLGRWRVFRYEVRRWRDGVIADASEAVASPQRLSDEELKFGDRLAAGPQRPPHRQHPSSGRGPRPGMAGRPGHGLPPTAERRARRTPIVRWS
jgi:hypothetical protein